MSAAAEKVRIHIEKAEQLAGELLEIFRPVVTRIEIAGSIRRRQMYVGDIELVMVPRIQPGGLFEEEESGINLQYELVNRLAAEGVLQDRLDVNGHRARGERFQRMLYKGVALDLFCVLPPAQFGVVFLIRTGPAAFNKELVRQRVEGGKVLQSGQRFEDGVLWDRGLPLETPEEIDVFHAIGLKFIEPSKRSEVIR